MLNFVLGADDRQKQGRREEVERREAARAESCARRDNEGILRRPQPVARRRRDQTRHKR